MKTRTWCSLWSSVVAFLLVQWASAQITIQKTDLQKMFIAHSTFKTYSDTSTVVSVGKTGGPNVYDFSSLAFRDSSSFLTYQSSDIPFLASRFDPSSFVMGSSTQMIQGSPVFLYTQNRLEEPANVTIFDSLQIVNYKVPHESVFQFPATYLTTWSDTGAGLGADTTFVNNVPTHVGTNLNNPKSSIIDGYGTLMLKGMSHQCLRIKTVWGSANTEKDFWYLTKDPISLVVTTTKDQNDTGKVTVTSMMCTTGATVTSVPRLASIPTAFSLSQNFPNPFNPSTNISFSLPQQSNVRFSVIDLLGREIAILVNNEKRNAGSYSVTWNAATLPSGVYFYRLQAGNYVETKKLVLLK
jgi:hypothetical protein